MLSVPIQTEKRTGEDVFEEKDGAVEDLKVIKINQKNLRMRHLKMFLLSSKKAWSSTKNKARAFEID